jgi:hypothetical protein
MDEVSTVLMSSGVGQMNCIRACSLGSEEDFVGHEKDEVMDCEGGVMFGRWRRSESIVFPDDRRCSRIFFWVCAHDSI